MNTITTLKILKWERVGHKWGEVGLSGMPHVVLNWYNGVGD